MKLHAILLALAVFFFSSAEAKAVITCSFTISEMPFGDVPVMTGNPDLGTATLDIGCTGTGVLSNLDVCVHLGTGGGGQFDGVRRMTTTGGTLDYAFFKDVDRMIPWGTGVSTPTFGTQVNQTYTILINLAGIGDLNTSMTIYGRVAGSQQTAHIGTYTSVFSGSHATVQYRIRSTLAAAGCTGSGTQTANPTFSVTASVAPACSITTLPGDIDFGNRGVIDANITAQTSLGVRCTNGTPYDVGIDGGGAGAVGTANRQMRLIGSPPGGPTVAYQLYQDNLYATVFGNAGSLRRHVIASGTTQTIDIFARVAEDQATPVAGTYRDTVVATITY